MGEIVRTQQVCTHYHHRQQGQQFKSQGSPVQIRTCPMCQQPTMAIANQPKIEANTEEEIVVKLRPAKFGSKRANVLCPHCQELITTELNRVDGTYVWYAAGCMFFLGFCLVFPWFSCCIPFIVDRFKDVEHYCPKCGKLIKTFKRLDSPA